MQNSRIIYLVVDMIKYACSYVLSQEADPEAGGHILEFLDQFAISGYNPSLGKISNDIFSKSIIIV